MKKGRGLNELRQYEKLLGEKYYHNQKQAILEKDYHNLSNEGKQDWIKSVKTQPLNDMRNEILETKASNSVEISSFRLKRHLLGKGTSFNEVNKLDEKEMPKLHDQVKKFKKGANEVSFAAGSIFEGMLELFGNEQHKALEKYRNKLHVIENESGSYIGQVKTNGNTHVFENFNSIEEGDKRLREFNASRMNEKKLKNEQELVHERTLNDKGESK